MESTSKSKWQIRLAALSIFVIGFVAGALALNLYNHTRRGPGSPPRGFYGPVLDRLDLNDEQKDQVEKILADTRGQLMEVRKQSQPQFEEIRKQTDEKLKTVLTPEQWEQFQQTISERRERRHHGRRGKQSDKD